MAGLIEDYALIGDMQTAALVGMNGCVECWPPRFHSPAAFAARCLATSTTATRLIAPVASEVPAARGNAVSRRYQGDTLILETEWTTASGVVRVIDFMPPRGGEQPVLIRIVRGVRGTVEMETVLRLRFGYGKIIPWVRRDKATGAVTAVAGPDSVWLRSPVRLTGSAPASAAARSRSI